MNNLDVGFRSSSFGEIDSMGERGRSSDACRSGLSSGVTLAVVACTESRSSGSSVVVAVGVRSKLRSQIVAVVQSGARVGQSGGLTGSVIVVVVVVAVVTAALVRQVELQTRHGTVQFFHAATIMAAGVTADATCGLGGLAVRT